LVSAPDGGRIEGRDKLVPASVPPLGAASSTLTRGGKRRSSGKKGKTDEPPPPFQCTDGGRTPHVRRRRNGTWLLADQCAGDQEHSDTEFAGVIDGRHLTGAIWRRGDPRDVPALRGKRETGRTVDQRPIHEGIPGYSTEDGRFGESG